MIYEAIRTYVVVASVLVALIGTPLLWRRWKRYLPENQLAWLSLVVLNFAIGYGTFETIRRDIAGGPRSVITAVAITWLLIAVCYQPAHELKRRRAARRYIRRLTKEKP